jgi:hypothetical protein
LLVRSVRLIVSLAIMIPAWAVLGGLARLDAPGPGGVAGRLFYVAVTRATSTLIVSYVRHAVRSKVEPSQFIAEMGLESAEEKRAKVLT